MVILCDLKVIWWWFDGDLMVIWWDLWVFLRDSPWTNQSKWGGFSVRQSWQFDLFFDNVEWDNYWHLFRIWNIELWISMCWKLTDPALDQTDAWDSKWTFYSGRGKTHVPWLEELLFGDALAQRDFSDPSVEGPNGDASCWIHPPFVFPSVFTFIHCLSFWRGCVEKHKDDTPT